MNLDDQQSMPLRWIFGLNKNPVRHGGGAIGKAFPDSTHLQSRPPKPWPRSGQSGDPNQAPTMTASRLMQNTSTEDDIKYWMGDPDDPNDKGATFDPPYQFPSYYTDYQRVSHHWDSSPRLGESDEYLSNMEDLQEIFGFKKSPERTYSSLVKNQKDYREKARETLIKASTHLKFKRKIMAKGDLSPRRIELIEKNEDEALNALESLKNKTENNLEFLKTHKDEFGHDANFPFLIAFYGDMLNKVDQALFSIRQASALQESRAREILRSILEEMEEEIDEVSSIGGGAIRGHIGPLGSDNQSPYMKKKKKKKKHYEPSMRAFGGAMEVD